MTSASESQATLTIVVNAERRAVHASCIPDLLRELGRDPAGVGLAVAVNAGVVPRAEWAAFRLADGDVVDLVGATQGG